MIELANLYVTQRNLKRIVQIPDLIEHIHSETRLDPIEVSEILDDLDQCIGYKIENGHHRAVAYYLSGRTTLQSHEYVETEISRRGILELLPALVARIIPFLPKRF